MEAIRQYYEKYKLAVYLILFLISVIVPFAVEQALILRYICTIMMYATLAGSLNVINGYSGQTCLGQAGFFCIGAYTCAALTKNVGLSFWIVLPLAGILAAAVGLLVSLPTLKLSGIYLSIVTLGASEIIRIIAQTWTPVTGGALGIKQIPYPNLFGLELFRPKYYYFIFLAIGILFLFVTGRVLRSRVGRAWMAIREDQVAANPWAWRPAAANAPISCTGHSGLALSAPPTRLLSITLSPPSLRRTPVLMCWPWW